MFLKIHTPDNFLSINLDNIAGIEIKRHDTNHMEGIFIIYFIAGTTLSVILTWDKAQQLRQKIEKLTKKNGQD